MFTKIQLNLGYFIFIRRWIDNITHKFLYLFIATFRDFWWHECKSHEGKGLIKDKKDAHEWWMRNLLNIPLGCIQYILFGIYVILLNPHFCYFQWWGKHANVFKVFIVLWIQNQAYQIIKVSNSLHSNKFWQ